MDFVPVAVVALARVRTAHGSSLEQAELARVQPAGEELVLTRLRRLDQPLDETRSKRVRVVSDGWLSDDGAAGKEPRRALASSAA